jgi:TldD protein
MKRMFIVAALLTTTPPSVIAAKLEPVGSISTAVTPEIVDAIAEEMDRAMARLELPDAPKPFHISYKITEVEVNDAVASLGFVTNWKGRHFVNIECRVRVKFEGVDNGNFAIPREEEIDGSAGTNLPLEATPRTARRAAWLVTDQAYKEALMQLRAKLDARTAGGVGATATSVWSDVKPIVSEDPVRVPALEDLATIQARAEKLSAQFRGQPQIRDSRVAVTSYLERRWYLASEGTSTHDTRRASGIIMVVAGQANDGQELAQYYSRYGATAADLPSDAELEVAGKQLASNLTALIAAPLITRYTGPVLFEGDAAVGVVRFGLAPQLDGTPLSMGLSPQEAKRFGGELIDKIGARVTAPMLSVVDDPTATISAGASVIGGYHIDDEGVPPEPVQVIKDGTLLSLLTARTVGKDGEHSNGHARRVAPGGAFHGTATNLIVTGKAGLTAAALQKKLLAEVKSAGTGYGVAIRLLDDAAMTATTELAKRELIQLVSNADPDLPPPTLLAYRVTANGKRELVRGAQLGELPIKAWRDVIAVSKTVTVRNFLASTQSFLEHKIGGVDEGFVPSSGIESSVATPDLLFKELDIVPSTMGLRARPMIPAPTGK